MNYLKPERLSYDVILQNRGCGISYLQKNHKIPFSDLASNSWFLREKLCDKIALDIPWSVLEPKGRQLLLGFS